MWGRIIRRYPNVLNIFYTNNSVVQKTLKSLVNGSHTVKRVLCTQQLEKKNKTYDDKKREVTDYSTFTYRTHTCGDLRSEHIGQNVILCGWVQYTRLSKFLLIRDSYGLTQCIVKNTDFNINDLPLETIVKITGTVVLRPKDMYNHEMATGEVEVVINKLEILNEVSKLPFNLRNYQKPKEQLRPQHRYIDLRFPEMQHILRQRLHIFRHSLNKIMWGRIIRRYPNVLNIFYTNNSVVQKTLKSLVNGSHTVKRVLCTQQLEKKNKTYDDKKREVTDYSTFTYRTHTCGDLRSEHIGQNVILCGWVQYTRLSKFLLIRDSYGLTQCIVKNTDFNINDLPLETIVKITGTVVLRPKDMYNHEMATGEVEVVINKLEILNEVSKLPFNLRNYQKPKEQLRPQHRYIDLRFPEMQHILRQRSTILHSMRRFLVEEHNFVEVETPTLFCRTPGGAREFVVHTHHSGLFYSLVQSPQQFKQMLMAGGIDRYFQIARCYRDETTRPDRQPEFTQLDIELSFTTLDGIINLIELLLRKTFNHNLPKKCFNRITYKEALESYGSDKPNIKYDMKMKNVRNLFNQSTDANFGAFVLPYPSKLGKLTAKYKEKINEIRKKFKVKVVLNENISKEIGQDTSDKINKITDTGNNNILSLGDYENVCLCLGEIRELLAALLKSKNLITINESLEPLWIVDFPLFVKGENGLETCHHPFTAPHPDDLHLLDSDPLKVRSLAYDIVLNGHEIGGGSVRIHNAELQERILKMLDIDSSNLSHFINALKSGCPPHAGIALGIDRLIAVLCNAESIRDVIAFPKSHEGKDPLSGAPNQISDKDQKYYHIRSIETKL